MRAETKPLVVVVLMGLACTITPAFQGSMTDKICAPNVHESFTTSCCYNYL